MVAKKREKITEAVDFEPAEKPPETRIIRIAKGGQSA